jgi:hypothetical protein
MRRSFLILTLLMAIFLPNLAQANERDLLHQITSPTAEATPDCRTTPLSRNPTADLTEFVPDPRQSTDFSYCGSCSPDPCPGLQRGTICGFDSYLGLFKRCEMYYGDSCPADNLVVCSCYAEIIP